MANEEQSKYVFELKDVDVLCGRGSGPNDRTGNIEFRNLILTRKAEYLAAKTREAKGRIASDIVQHVRRRGGRFLKKLSPAQVKEAGFKRGVAVYEYADEPTVLEKAKQTLRQNRAAFEKMHGDVANDDGVVNEDNYDTEDFGVATTNFAQLPPPAASIGNSGGISSASMTLNPISLSQSSFLLDSDKLPPFGSSEAKQLQTALFASSSISSKDINNGNRNMKFLGLNEQVGRVSSHSDQMNFHSPQLGFNAQRLSSSISSKDMPSSSIPSGRANLSIDPSLLMGSDKSGMSTSSIEGFGSLIKEFSAPDQVSLMQQYDALKEQQQVALMQQYEVMKRQHEHMMQSIYPRFSPESSNETNTNNYRNFPHHYSSQNGPCESAGGASISSVNTSMIQNFSGGSSARHHHERRNSDGFSSDVFRSLMREYTEAPSAPNQYQSAQVSRTSNESGRFSNYSDFSQLSKDPVCAETLGTMARQQDFNDQQKLLHQYTMLQGQQFCGPCANQDVNTAPTIYENHTNEDNYLTTHDDGNARPVQGAQAMAKKQQHRPSRKTRIQSVDQSLTLSFVTGKSLASKLKDDPMNTSGSSASDPFQPGSHSNKGSQAPRDSSLLSLMSMSVSLSEISHDLKGPGVSGNSRPCPEKMLGNTMNVRQEKYAAEGTRRESSNLEELTKIDDISMMSLGDGWALDDDCIGDNIK
ncbi:hypothetical protein ACHAW6_013128 [Cyclotella cf. meneghiniana]